jgi:hypothetical protein
MTLYRSIGSGEPEAIAPTVPELPHLPELASVADTAWTAVATGQGIRGYETIVDGGEAVIRDPISPTCYREIRLLQTDTGSWYITEVVQRPSLEIEGFAGVVRETIAYPLDGVEPTSRSRTFGRPQGHQLLFPDPEVAFGEPVTDVVCARLLDQLREVTGEQPLVARRSVPRWRNWLHWLGIGS